MLGAITGDIVGSIYENEETAIKTKDFPLFSDKCHVTDDTIMTLAVCEGILNGLATNDFKTELERCLFTMAKLYPNAGYGKMFTEWVWSKNKMPYNSYGNGSAMRVSSVGWIFNNLSDVEKYAEISASVTHNHPEGIKGAKAIAGCIFLARKKYSKQNIKEYVQNRYGYNLNRTCDEIRPLYSRKVSCQESVPEAIICFLDGKSFEDTIRNAISLGGDSDTLAAMAGSIAEAFFTIPSKIAHKALKHLDPLQRKLLVRFNNYIINV